MWRTQLLHTACGALFAILEFNEKEKTFRDKCVLRCNFSYWALKRKYISKHVLSKRITWIFNTDIKNGSQWDTWIMKIDIFTIGKDRINNVK